MALIFATAVLLALIMAPLHFWRRFFADSEEEEKTARRWFVRWTLKGVFVPLAVWAFFNSGILFPPWLPYIEYARNRGFGFSAFLDVIAAGTLVIGTFWCTISFAWLLTLIACRVESLREFVVSAAFWSILLFPIALGIIFSSGWVYAGLAGLIWLCPLVHATIALAQRDKLVPVYSGALAKMNFGKYEEAEWEVIRQLELCENDFEGWMMLAKLYANYFHDLPTAERTVLETCEQPNANASQIAAALHTLADWHLKLGDDPIAAKKVLTKVCERFPNTHLSRMARQRIGLLPSSREELAEQRKVKTLRLPALRNDLERDVPDGPPVDLIDAAAEANQCMTKLNADPNDIVARETLARIFAEKLGKADLAIEQLELLLAMPERAQQKVAEWLALMAAWQIKYRRDEESVQRVLRQIVDEFPQSPQAFAARCRLNVMEVEAKMRSAAVAGLSTHRPKPSIF